MNKKTIEILLLICLLVFSKLAFSEIDKLYDFNTKVPPKASQFNNNFKLLLDETEKLKKEMDELRGKLETLNNKKMPHVNDDKRIISTTYISKLGPSDIRDDGLIESRYLKVTKLYGSTVLRLGYTDNFRVIGINKACRWEILVDGISCPSSKLIYDGHDGNNSNVHKSNHLVGYCSGLNKGEHYIQVSVTSHPDFRLLHRLG